VRPLIVLVPSRGRPQNAARLADAFEHTCTLPDTRLVFGVDDDDHTGGEYLPLRSARVGVDVVPSRGVGMNAALNRLAGEYAPRCQVIGFMGDDHLPRTVGWDARVCEALAQRPGVAYADDLLQREALPTQVFLTSTVVETLGWMAPPLQRHLYLDNFWLYLGQRVGITYLPDVVIEHLHPLAKKADVDDGYKLVNARQMYEHDEKAFAAYLAGDFDTDVARVKAALHG